VIEPQLDRCTRCRRETRWLISGQRNGDTPLVLLWRCTSCGHERAQLGKGAGCVRDVARLAEMIVNERRRTAVADQESARLDYEDAEAHVAGAIYDAYVRWDPARNPKLISFVTWKARCALTNWFREELGQFTPKAHAWAYSMDALDNASVPEDGEYGDGETVVAGESRVDARTGSADASIMHALVLIEDDETRGTLRSIVLPISLGLSHAEVADLHGMTEAWVGAQLRKLRERDDLRVPA
jgi:hypothetical protein